MPARRRPPAGSRTELPPLKIIRKILLLQAAYYVCATVLILFTTVVYGAPFSFNLVFGWDSLRGDTTIGWMLGLVWMLNCFVRWVILDCPVEKEKPRSGQAVRKYWNQGLTDFLGDSQRHFTTSIRFPLKAGPRFRPDHSLPPRPHHNPLYSLHPHKSPLVGSSVCQCGLDDIPWNVGLSKKGAWTHQVWRAWH